MKKFIFLYLLLACSSCNKTLIRNEKLIRIVRDESLCENRRSHWAFGIKECNYCADTPYCYPADYNYFVSNLDTLVNIVSFFKKNFHAKPFPHKWEHKFMNWFGKGITLQGFQQEPCGYKIIQNSTFPNGYGRYFGPDTTRIWDFYERVILYYPSNKNDTILFSSCNKCFMYNYGVFALNGKLYIGNKNTIKVKSLLLEMDMALEPNEYIPKDTSVVKSWGFPEDY